MQTIPRNRYTLTWFDVRFSIGVTDTLWIDAFSVDLDNPDDVETMRLLKQNYRAFLALTRLSELTAEYTQIEQYLERYVGYSESHNDKEMFAGFENISEVHEQIEEMVKLALSQEYWFVPDNIDTLADRFSAALTKRQKYLHMIQMREQYNKFKDGHVGFVYLFKLSTGHYKIGYSNNPQRRGREITSGLPITLELVHKIPSNQISCLEDELHQRFKRCRHGTTEWFSLDDEDIKYIQAITERNYEWVDNPEWDEFYEMIAKRVLSRGSFPRAQTNNPFTPRLTPALPPSSSVE